MKYYTQNLWDSFADCYTFQVLTDMYRLHLNLWSPMIIRLVLEIFSAIVSHSEQLNSVPTLRKKIQKACSILEISEPPMVHFENESYQNYLNFIHDLLIDNPSISKEMNLESLLVSVCENILRIYLKCTELQHARSRPLQKQGTQWILPLGSARKEELAARTSLLIAALKELSSLERGSFLRYVPTIFPLLVDLVRSEHSSGEIPHVLSSLFESCIGPIIIQ